ncbi:MAG TPA: Crp/Fnr family transcriptional regulator [Desulfobulbaceae bacterium]|nr:Crp/Fnr family transcriptional regulator [Desulfobulbaceae bacterium]
MQFKKIPFRVSATRGCPLYLKDDCFVISGIAVLMDNDGARSLVTTTVIRHPADRENCSILSADLNRLVIAHERADLIPQGTYTCSGCSGTLSLEYDEHRSNEMDKFLKESEQASGLLPLLENFPFFSNIEREDLEEVVRSFRLKRCARNEIIVRQGDPGDNFYIVVSGRVSVINQTGISIAELSAGEVFGEMSLISEEHASATVQAVEDSEILYVDNREFQNILQKYPLLQRYFTRLLARRLTRANTFRSVDYVSIMTGRLEEFSPEALFQSLHASRKTGILTLSGLPEGTARFSFRQGAMIRASYGRKKGKTAFYDVLREKSGTFRFTPGLPPEDFDAPEIGYFMKLLMTGLEKADQQEQE